MFYHFVNGFMFPFKLLGLLCGVIEQAFLIGRLGADVILMRMEQRRK